MANPWLKKNPFMSMWLSAANAAAGSMRGHAAGEVRRQAATAVTRATKEVLGAWMSGAAPARSKKLKRR